MKSEISADCQNIIWGFANYPQDYEDLILKMIHRSGKQINDLGRYAEWISDPAVLDFFNNDIKIPSQNKNIYLDKNKVIFFKVNSMQ